MVDEAVIRRTMLGLLPKKYPEYGDLMQSVDLSGVAVFRVDPEVVSVLDYSKGFAHTDLVTVAAADRAVA